MGIEKQGECWDNGDILGPGDNSWGVSGKSATTSQRDISQGNGGTGISWLFSGCWIHFIQRFGGVGLVALVDCPWFSMNSISLFADANSSFASEIDWFVELLPSYGEGGNGLFMVWFSGHPWSSVRLWHCQEKRQAWVGAEGDRTAKPKRKTTDLEEIHGSNPFGYVGCIQYHPMLGRSHPPSQSLRIQLGLLGLSRWTGWSSPLFRRASKSVRSRCQWLCGTCTRCSVEKWPWERHSVLDICNMSLLSIMVLLNHIQSSIYSCNYIQL